MDRRVAAAADIVTLVAMAGQKARSAVFAPEVPAIHVLLAADVDMTWMPPRMTNVQGKRGLPPFHRFQFIDQIGNDVQPAIPELRVTRVEPERCQQFGMMLGATRRKHREVAFGKT